MHKNIITKNETINNIFDIKNIYNKQFENIYLKEKIINCPKLIRFKIAHIRNMIIIIC